MEIKSILIEALECVKRARGIKPLSAVEASALRWEIYAALQNTLDAMAMITADLGLRKPSSYSELGLILHQNEFINRNIAETVRKIAAVRNTLAHAYRRVSREDLMEIVNKLLPEVETVVNSSTKLTEEKSIDPKARIHGITKDQISKLADTFKKNEVLAAYLFGSRAREIFREDSDYDIAVLFKRENVSILTEADLAVEIADTLKVPSDKVDIVSLNKQEFPLIARVLKEGILIYQQDEAFRKNWERKAYLELLKNMDLYAPYLKRALKHIK
ncbi:MAG: HepT-like ribonuclease domain-containing protein [Candidatus Bathyarchaeia archaeon]